MTSSFRFKVSGGGQNTIEMHGFVTTVLVRNQETSKLEDEDKVRT